MDSFTSLVIVKYLKQLASSGKTVVCTIHQPSSEIFQYIDRIILLKDGRLVYQGKAENSIKYFSEIGCPFPAFCNPFDFFLEILSDANESLSARELNKNYMKLCEEEVRMESIKLREEFKSQEIVSLRDNTRQIGWFSEYALLLKRTVMNYTRNKSLFFARVINCVFNTIIIAGFYWRIGDTDKYDPKTFSFNYVGFFFNNLNQFFINGMYTALFMIPTIKAILKREYSAKLYRISSFFCALATTVLINSIIYAIIFSPITYFVIDMLKDFEHLFYYFCFNFFIFTLGQYFGLAIGGAFPEQVTFVVSPLLFIFFFLGSGMYRDLSSLPSWISWLFYISPYKYGLEVYVRIESSFKPDERIPENFHMDLGIEKCLPILAATMVTILILGGSGIKLFSSKF
jgi:hypothetical protein